MTTAAQTPTSFANISRTLCSVAAGVALSVERAVVGDAKVRTAKGNAWEAVCADRARARQRDEMRRAVADLAQTRSPRVPQLTR